YFDACRGRPVTASISCRRWTCRAAIRCATPAAGSICSKRTSAKHRSSTFGSTKNSSAVLRRCRISTQACDEQACDEQACDERACGERACDTQAAGRDSLPCTL